MTYELTNQPEPPGPWKPKPAERTTQGKLFSGLDCLPGQRDLFETDGADTTTNTKEDKQ